MKGKKAGPRAPRLNGGGGYRPRVIIKLQDYLEPEAEGGKLRDAGPWDALARAFPGIRARRLFQDLPTEKLRALTQKAVDTDPAYRPPNLRAYYAVDCPVGVQPDALVQQLAAWPNVQTAYVEGGPTPPPLVNPADDPRSVNQGYLDPAPDGIDAEYAWGLAGGDGVGQGFVDLEQGWTLNHEDLVAAGITLISGVSNAYHGHGTAVLGEVRAEDNTLGCVGISPRANTRVVSQWRTTSTYSTAEAIMSAVSVMSFGQVLLLEAQTSTGGFSFIPVEVEPAVRDAIRLGSALGIIVVEAAGNGGNDLDTVTDGSGRFVFNRAHADFRESGAIMVGAASSTAPHTRLGFSNFGSRIDCYGWGQGINTTGDGWTGNLTTSYTTSFGGTSGASPIISGAALAVQGILSSSAGQRLSPGQMRALLSNPANGTSSANPPVDRIGVMPNLRAIIDTVLGVTPDVYLRDFVGDTGDPHSGAISASPDIIVRPTAVADPQASYGEGSGTENSATLGASVEAGQNNFIYVRVRNRGGSAANVQATVFWSPVSTLVTPDLWTHVGSTTLPSVPTGDVLTVSNAIVWASGGIPAPGHYCFVGLIGNGRDPAPSPADFLDWNNFQRFIRENNNVTWRNFNVVNLIPPNGGEPPRYVALPFLSPGAPDKARRFGLEVVARLPEGAQLRLEMPLNLLEALEPRPSVIHVDRRRKVAIVALRPSGRQKLGEAVLPARSRSGLRLLVHVPKQQRKFAYEVAVRQLYEREEVGRVTWRLVAQRKQ